jgi:predicted PurR-regulated permease PerM
MLDPDPLTFTAAHDAPWRTKWAPQSLGLAILSVIAVVAALYLARAFFVPLLIGILTSYALWPIVDRMKGARIPRPLGAALVLGALIAGTAWATFSLADDAAAVIESLPAAVKAARLQMRVAREGLPTPLQNFQEAAAELQGAATDATGKVKAAAAPSRPEPVFAAAPSVWLRDYMLTQSALLFTVASQAPIVLLLAYFLLASGGHFRRKLDQLVGPSLLRKQNAGEILDEIDLQVQRYLLVTVAANLVVGVGTWLAFSALGMEHAAAWGVGAGLLHFIPYLGPLVFAVVCGMAGFLQFGTLPGALAVAGASLLIATAVGSLLVTWVQSRSARVNAAVLFIALLFFGWLWGIWGLLLGAPLVAIAKVICDRVDVLRPAGELLGH